MCVSLRKCFKKFLLGSFFTALAAITAAAQGGKAEPRRLAFVGEKAVAAGRLSNGQEMEYIFTAKKGQKLTVVNGKTSLFDFRVFNEEFDVETEFESSRSLTIDIPESGSYYFFVRKKMVNAPRTAGFSITLTLVQ